MSHLVIARIDCLCPIMNNITFSTFENYTLSDVPFYKNIINGRITTGLGDRIYSSFNVLALISKRSFILSSNKKPFIGLCGVISLIDPNVE